MKRIAVVSLHGCYTSSTSLLVDLVQVVNALTDGTRVQLACDVVTLTGMPARLTDGLALAASASIDTGTQYDLVFVPAMDYPDSTTLAERLANCGPVCRWLRQQWQGGAIVASLCTGTFVLAEAGLLDRRLATTSWWLEKQFHRAYPAVKLDITRDLTESDRVVCGSTLGVGAQLALKLIEMLTSPAIGAALARSVMFGFDADSERTAVADDDDLVSRAQSWFVKNMAKKVKLAEAAASMLVSERTLIRHFKKKLGITPHAYLQGIRIDCAKDMLRETSLRISKVAERVGYADVAFFQQVFRDHVGVSPTVFRRQALYPAHAAIDAGACKYGADPCG
jgi:transcriptional regulator GlxA family with amidase domain